MGIVSSSKLFVCGGADGNRLIHSSAEYFDLQTFSWNLLNSMGKPRFTPAGGAADGKIYICGGYDGEASLKSMECLDVVSGTWQPAPPMLTAREGAASCVVGGKLFIFGGVSH